MDTLNYHHLRYFREVAREGNLTRAAERLNLSQSALSTQIKTLEARLGHDLFDRVGRSLKLTEEGVIALDYADRIFGAGRELLATLNRSAEATPPLRVGALSTLSRNFQTEFLAPVMGRDDASLILRSGSAEGLLQDLRALALDLVLTTEPPGAVEGSPFAVKRLDEQAVGLHGAPERLTHRSLPALLDTEPLILPTESSIRAGFEGLVDRLGVAPRVVASVDDMAMVRLLARRGVGVAVAPAVVLADEIASGRLATAPFELGLVESFFAVTVKRNFPHPLLTELLGA
ncbi:MAG: LysR family transcriptional regulator [Pseudomonadota bacterium]